VVQDTGKEVLCRLAQIHRLPGRMGRRPAGGVDKAHVNVHAIADEFGIRLW